MTVISDLSLDWPSSDGLGPAGDFQTDVTGDLLTVDGVPETRQRIVRRWLSNSRGQASDGTILAPDLIYDVNYGVSLRRSIGSAVNAQRTESTKQQCRDAMLAEEGVAPQPPPDVALRSGGGSLILFGSFTSAYTKRAVALPRVTLS